MTVRVGIGFDVHPFDESRRLVLGGVTIDGPGLAGHSDADVVAHAVADALLAPAGLPDLGMLYPESDERFRDADSMSLLADVVARVAAAGWTVGNVDVVIAAERPRLSPHIDAMRLSLGAVLAQGGGEPFVSVRPKRGEGVGAVGRGEGIAVWAAALIERA